MRHPSIDSTFTLYSLKDSSSFLNFSNVQISFLNAHKYLGLDANGKLSEGTWFYDSAKMKLITDTTEVDLVSHPILNL